MVTVKELKSGAVLPDPIYRNLPYIIVAKEGNVLDSGTLEEMKKDWTYYDDCEVKVREHDLYVGSNLHINDKVETVLTVIYDSELGICTPDAKSESKVKEILDEFFTKTTDQVEFVSTELLIAHFRLAVKRGDIKSERIRIQFEDQILPISSTGRVSPWPRGFCDYHLDVLAQL